MNLFALATHLQRSRSAKFMGRAHPESKLAAEREGGIRRSVSLLQKMNPTARSLLVGAALLAVIWAAPSAMAQPSPSGPPVVGVIKVERRPMTDSYEFNGRIVAINSVNIIARLIQGLAAAEIANALRLRDFRSAAIFEFFNTIEGKADFPIARPDF